MNWLVPTLLQLNTQTYVEVLHLLELPMTIQALLLHYLTWVFESLSYPSVSYLL